MKTSNRLLGIGQILVASAVCAVYGPAQAQEIDQLTAPGTSSVSVGVGLSSGEDKDRARSGMFNGLRKHDTNGLLGFSYADRDASTGRWLSVEGRNVGLDNREFGISYRLLGDMKLWGDYSEIVRHDPRTFNSGLIGAGTTTPTVVVTGIGAGSELTNMQLKRKSLSLNAEKLFGGALQLEVNFKNEDKDGARFFGRGFACTSAAAPACTGGPTATATGWALLMLPEPVDSTIRQLDVKLNWSRDKLNLTGGYYGSFYTNANGNISPTVPASLRNGPGTLLPLGTGLQAILNLPVALWPDNKAHQFYLSGNYKFTPSTRVNFKYSYTHATQNEDFGSMGLANAPAGRTNLGGEMNWTKAQVGFAAHPLSPLHLHGDLKYESKRNKTPVDTYNIEGTGTFSNTVQSPKKLDGKLEANYTLPAGYNLVGGVHFENEDFGAFTPTANVAGISGIRQKLKETGYRLELRKSISETLTGSASFHSAKREGDSPWLKPVSLSCQGVATSAAIAGMNGTGVIPADTGLASVTTCATFNNGLAPASVTSKPIFPFLFEDRKQDKLRLVANWTPMERLGLTFLVEDGKDKYTHPSTDHGLRDSGNRMYSVDASYALSDAWKLSAYWSRGDRTVSAGHSTGYDANLRDIADSLGIGVIGKPTARLNVGADLTFLDDTLKYNQRQDTTCLVLIPGCSAANVASVATNIAFLNTAGGLPDVKYRLLRLKFFGAYAIDKVSYVRLDLIHESTRFNEWTYNFNGTPFSYNDGTTLTAKERQSVNFVGASYIYKFQ
jgi:MtrB/PioB family decaheme-associated outer membrane protein